MRHGLSLGYVSSYLFRGLLLPLFIVGIGLLGPCDIAIAQKPRAITQTGNRMHLAVVGDGYIAAQESNTDGKGTGRRYFVRSNVLYLNEVGMLCCRAGDKELSLEPLVTIPQGNFKVEITTTGIVYAKMTDNEKVQANGRLQVVHFQDLTGAIEVAPGIITFASNDGRDQKYGNFGEETENYVLQGWLDTPVFEALQKPTKSDSKETK